jgi:hypothetical protein
MMRRLPEGVRRWARLGVNWLPLVAAIAVAAVQGGPGRWCRS